MTKVFTIASGKGGTGKTTTTVNLGTALAQLGKETTVLDADIGMANLGLVLGHEEEPVTLHQVLSGEETVNNAVYESYEGLKVVPAGLSLEGFEKADSDRLEEALTYITKKTEYLLIDAPAGLSKESMIPLSVADEVILVVNPEISSMADATKTNIMAEKLGTDVAGAVLTRTSNEESEMNVERIEEILEVEVLERVPEDPEVRKSAIYKRPVVVHSPNSPASRAYKRLASRLSGEEFEDEISEEEEEEGFVSRMAKTLFG